MNAQVERLLLETATEGCNFLDEIVYIVGVMIDSGDYVVSSTTELSNQRKQFIDQLQEMQYMFQQLLSQSRDDSGFITNENPTLKKAAGIFAQLLLDASVLIYRCCYIL